MILLTFICKLTRTRKCALG